MNYLLNELILMNVHSIANVYKHITQLLNLHFGGHIFLQGIDQLSVLIDCTLEIMMIKLLILCLGNSWGTRTLSQLQNEEYLQQIYEQ